MTHQIFNLPPQQPLTAAGRVLPGSKVSFFVTTTSTPADVYTTSALNVAHTQPVEADGGGRLATIYLDPEVVYKATVTDANDVLLYTVDPVNDQLLSAESIGLYLYPRTPEEIAAGVTPTDYSHPPGYVPRYGVVGDGVTNDSAAMAVAISTSINLDLGELSVRIVTKLTFDQADQRISASGGGFLFDGANTTRIADITAAGVEFHGVYFDGNDLQPSYALVMIDDDAARPVFSNCVFHDMLGVTSLSTTPLNQMYAILISPYGVTDLLIDRCVFRDLTKHNDTAEVGTPTIGLGFCGGIFFGREDSDLTAVQTTPTSGTINECSFRDIITVIDAALSESDRLDFDDADAIRIAGSTTVTWLPVKMTNLRFTDVSKRCIKISTAGGQHIENIHVEASTSLAYGMASIAKLDNDCFMGNVRAVASSTRRFIIAIQMQGELNCVVDGLYVSHCETGYDLSPSVATPYLRNIELRNALFQDVSENGYNQSVAGDQQENIVLENVRVIGSDATRGFHNISGLTDANGGHKYRNCQSVNADVKVEGKNNEVTNMLVHVSDDTYAGSSSTRALVEIGLGTGTVGHNIVRGLRVFGEDIDDNYTTATRTRLVLLYGDATMADGIYVTVPDTMNTTYASIELSGDDCVFKNVELRGPGFIRFGIFEVAVRSALRGATRLGNGATSSKFVELGVASSDDLIVENVIDMRPVSAASVLVNNAGGAYLIHGVQTRSSVGAVSDVGGKATVIDTQSV